MPRKRFARTYKEAKRLKASLTTDVGRGEYREVSRCTFAIRPIGPIEGP